MNYYQKQTQTKPIYGEPVEPILPAYMAGKIALSEVEGPVVSKR